ncbi:MAG TPA: SDR family NAD(P)-dependent oxidoreductase [Conexibacter sp.]|nr:SDR family NAD(P)-dependent oxidoreductase [Conexibacter sp.]
MGELDGRVAIVTGGAAGIGAGIVRVLAREGAQVVIADVDAERAAALTAEPATHGRAEAVATDVTDRASCEQVVAHALARHGRVDVLVNNAGVCPRGSFRTLAEADWDRVMDVNLKGLYLMTQAAVEPMIERGAGAIVTIASVDGKEAAPLGAAYGATKAGAIALTQANAKELAPRGVRVNAVCPGVVRTALWEPLLDQLAAERGVSREQAFADCVAAIPLGRPQEPEDVGEAVAFLASERARNVTGVALNVAGGQELR